MKRPMLTIALAGLLISCNDNTTHADHKAHSMDPSGGANMMALMESMMDNMKKIESSGNPDNDFATLMKEHHLGAIEMAKLEISKGTNPQIKRMAEKMIKDQEREVSEFNAFLSGHKPHGSSDAYFKEAMSIMNNMKMDMNHSGSVDTQFVEIMIPHHQTAVDMSKAYMKKADHQTLIKIANNIIASQSKEIIELKNWLKSQNQNVKN